MHRLCFAIVVVGLATLASPLARAQEPDTLTAAQRASLALARLGGNTLVRLHATGRGRVSGSVVSSSANLLTVRTTLGPDGSTVNIPAAAVDSLWVKSGDHAGSGALVGGALGGLGLGVAATVATSGAHGPCDGGCGVGPFLLGLVGGGAVGALVGALVGSGVTEWQLWVP
jgi:hypothetical protein